MFVYIRLVNILLEKKESTFSIRMSFQKHIGSKYHFGHASRRKAASLLSQNKLKTRMNSRKETGKTCWLAGWLGREDLATRYEVNRWVDSCQD